METSQVPRCYILDERYRLILACVPSPDDPFNDLYEANSTPDALPREVELTVRVLAGRWERHGEPHEASALVHGVRVTVAPMQGAAGRHIAVFVIPESLDPAQWTCAASA